MLFVRFYSWVLMHNVILLPKKKKNRDVDVADFLEREALGKVFNRAQTSKQVVQLNPYALGSVCI